MMHLLHDKRPIQVCLAASVLAACIAVLSPLSVHGLNIAARVSDQSTELRGGDRLYFEVEIKYPENTTRKDLRIEYQIRQEGEVVASEKVLRAVETQASFLDYIVVPKSANSGMHELQVIVEDYESLHQEVTATFIVRKGVDQITTYFFIIMGAIVLIGVLVFVQMQVLLHRLKEQQQ